MDDTSLLAQVIEELASDPGVDATWLCVDVHGGVVAVTGNLASYAEKCRALRAVLRVRGVEAVIGEITVFCGAEGSLADESLLRRIRDCLSWALVVPPGVIVTKVRRGWVILAGAVGWDYQRRECEEIVGRLAGVTGVINLLEVRPRIRAIDIAAVASYALCRNADIRAENIDITFVGGDVTLTGSVRSWFERNAVNRMVWSIPGVTKVRDRMVHR